MIFQGLFFFLSVWYANEKNFSKDRLYNIYICIFCQYFTHLHTHINHSVINKISKTLKIKRYSLPSMQLVFLSNIICIFRFKKIINHRIFPFLIKLLFVFFSVKRQIHQMISLFLLSKFSNFLKFLSFFLRTYL